MPAVTFEDEIAGQVLDVTQFENRFNALRDAVNDAYRNQGPYSATTLYAKNDVVTEGTTQYAALEEVQGELPSTTPDKWKIYAQGGGAGSSGPSASSSVSITTVSLVPGNRDTAKKVKIARVFALSDVTTSRSAWVRVYADDASRIADLDRGQNDDPVEGVNIVLEFRTDALRLNIPTPNVIVSDSQSTALGFPSTIVNLGSSGTVVVTFDFYQIQGY